MNCGITGEEWTDYLDRALPAMERRRIESHLLGCADCRAEAESLRLIDQRLRIECGAFAQSFHVEPQGASPERIMSALREAAAVTGVADDHEKLWRVRWVLALLCGPNTAGRVIDCARRGDASRDGSCNDAPEQGWVNFLSRLSFLTTEICGCHAGELILAVGK
jgi:hypothetical protein